jgi:uncharacterized protein (TIGR02246 family)
MKSKTVLRVTCLAFLGLGALLVQVQSQSSQGEIKMEHAQIQKTIDNNNAAVAARDMEAILATYDAHATLVGQPGMPPAVGTLALREAFKQFLAINPRITILSQDVVQSSDVALHTYTWKMSGKTPDGHPIEQGGFSIIVLRKQADGKWLMVIDNPFGDVLLRKG